MNAEFGQDNIDRIMSKEEKDKILRAYTDILEIRADLNKLRMLHYLPDDGCILLAEDALNTLRELINLKDYDKDNRTKS